MAKLDGQVAIVTGAGRGIGRGIARALAAEGAHLVLAARTVEEIGSVAQEIRTDGGTALAVRADVTQEADIRSLVDTTMKSFRRLDILVNNAGVGVFREAVDLRTEEFDRMWNVNVRGVFLMTKVVLPVMMKARSGAIVNIASLAGKNAFKGGTGYGATKWALRGFSASLMLEVREHGIRVVTIFPGSVDTSFSGRGKRVSSIPQPEDVAGAVVFAVTAPGRALFSEIDLRPTNPPK